MNKGQVLYIEDNHANRLLVQRILASRDYSMIAAEDGVAGLEMIRQLKPKLVLLDIDLPRMDGIEIVGHVRNDETICDTIIVAVTASSSEGDRERLLEAGCDDYLPKPVRIQDLLKIVEHSYST